jgi:ribosomal protein S18 acetylase RimI-like enzyme
MCFGAILLHGIGRVVYGAVDPRGGAVGLIGSLPPYVAAKAQAIEWRGPALCDACDPLRDRAFERAALERTRRSGVIATPPLSQPDVTIAEVEPTAELVQFLDDQLYAFNVETTGIADGQPLGLVVRSADGELHGGAVGHTWGRSAKLRLLWISPKLRGRGFGKGLIEEFARAAKARGCVQLLVSTHSFQAPALYGKLGFQEIARIENHPLGHADVMFLKRLG